MARKWMVFFGILLLTGELAARDFPPDFWLTVKVLDSSWGPVVEHSHPDYGMIWETTRGDLSFMVFVDGEDPQGLRAQLERYLGFFSGVQNVQWGSHSYYDYYLETMLEEPYLVFTAQGRRIMAFARLPDYMNTLIVASVPAGGSGPREDQLRELVLPDW